MKKVRAVTKKLKHRSRISGSPKQSPHSQRLLRGVMLLMLVSVICSCASRETYSVKMIPMVPEPTIPKMPISPSLAKQLPHPIVITQEEVDYYNEVCEAWESGEYSKEEMEVSYQGLSRSAACDWAIYGHTVQGQLTMESIMVQQATYAEQLRAYIDMLVGIIEMQKQVAAETRAAIEEVNKTPTRESKGGFGSFSNSN